VTTKCVTIQGRGWEWLSPEQCAAINKRNVGVMYATLNSGENTLVRATDTALTKAGFKMLTQSRELDIEMDDLKLFTPVRVLYVS